MAVLNAGSWEALSDPAATAASDSRKTANTERGVIVQFSLLLILFNTIFVLGLVKSVKDAIVKRKKA